MEFSMLRKKNLTILKVYDNLPKKNFGDKCQHSLNFLLDFWLRANMDNTDINDLHDIKHYHSYINGYELENKNKFWKQYIDINQQYRLFILSHQV